MLWPAHQYFFETWIGLQLLAWIFSLSHTREDNVVDVFYFDFLNLRKFKFWTTDYVFYPCNTFFNGSICLTIEGKIFTKNLKYISNKNERIETSCPSKRRLVEMVI